MSARSGQRLTAAGGRHQAADTRVSGVDAAYSCSSYRCSNRVGMFVRQVQSLVCASGVLAPCLCGQCATRGQGQ
jgi:hypothetical protein